ncbi:MAG: hypothetical protein CL681_16600 [Blastopirellula sp.]|nr:hypothetical protein [Blastopirellula sp.]
MSEKQPNLDSLFEAAVEIKSAKERAAFLDKSCGDDQELRQQIEQLLQSNDQVGSFLEQPAPGVEASVAPIERDNIPTALDAGLALAFGEDASVVIGDANHSVLRSIYHTIDEVPRVSLRQSKAEGEDPITRPSSTEVPLTDSDSRYRLDGEIARGGMGVIIKGRDTDLGRDLAIKVLLGSHKDKPDVIQRFVEEAQIGGQLQHPGIAPVYELGKFADQRPYFSMKLVKGETLAKQLGDRSDPKADRGRFLSIFEQVCQTMAYAHCRGVIHRDLKPANIMVGAFGEVQVMDWGLAKVLSAGGVADEKNSLQQQQGQSTIQTLRSGLGSDTPVGAFGSQTRMGSVMGTPAYMPPEQALGEIANLDERADVFGLGAILCEILTGKPAYVGDDSTAISRLARCGKLDEAFTRLDACAADAGLISLTKDCLEPEPVNRPRDASEVAGRVTGYLESVETKLREAEIERAAQAARAEAETDRANAESARANAESARVEEERKRRRVQLALVASVLLLVGLGGAGWAGLKRRAAAKQHDAEASRMVEGLLHADTSQVITIIKNLKGYRRYATDDLEKAFTESPDDSNAKLHAALAMLPEDPSVLPFLKERLLTVSPMQFAFVCELLSGHKDELVSGYWEIATDSSQEPARRFQAACALASFDTDNEHWQEAEFARFVAGHLVGVLPSELLPWRNALEPVKARLTSPLAAIYRDAKQDALVRGFATDTLADYLSDDAEGLFDLLADANEKQFAPMFGKLSGHRERAIALGNAEVGKTADKDASEDAKEALAMRQANAAVLLLRLDAAEKVFPLLKHSPDPRVRSYIIHWLSPRGGDPQPIIARYERETDVTIKRALLLCLGEFELADTEKRPLIETLLTLYRNDPDAGLHAGAEWLLRRWGQAKKIAAIDKELQQTEDQLAKEKDSKRQWYINMQGQTFAILDAGEFQMGSPGSEAGRMRNEQLHSRKIGRRFAISTKEVTWAQWRAFVNSVKGEVPGAKLTPQERLKRYIRTDDSPVAGITWYNAACYCNWLSKQEGIPEEQWCYETNDQGQYGSGMKAREKFWELSGFRLPTEAEWEFACRAGANTSRYYGATERLLLNYAWYQVNGDSRTHPVASLKPNDLGLFDMQGNVFEWGNDVFAAYPSGSKDVVDAPKTDAVTDSFARVARGGSFGNPASLHRSALRDVIVPSVQIVNLGFRPARTYNLSR